MRRGRPKNKMKRVKLVASVLKDTLAALDEDVEFEKLAKQHEPNSRDFLTTRGKVIDARFKK